MKLIFCWFLVLQFVAELTTEERAIAAAAPSESERFCVIVDTGKDIDAETSQQCSSAKIGEKVGKVHFFNNGKFYFNQKE